MAGTETLGGTRPQVVIANRKDGVCMQKFVNDNGSALVAGQEVYLKSDGTVAARATATKTSVPIGVVYVGGDDGENVTVQTNFTMIINVVKGTAGANAGTMVRPVGTINANGLPNYEAVVSNDLSQAMMLEQTGSADENCRVGILPQIYVAP